MAITEPTLAAPGLTSLHFSSAAFDGLIQAHGVSAFLRQARRCACFRRDSDAPDPACTLCRPYGWIWDPAVACVVHGPGRRPRRGADAEGSGESGEVVFSFPTGTIPTYMARLILPTARLIVDDLLTKGEEDVIRWSEVLAVDRADYTVRSPASGPNYDTVPVSLKIQGKDASPDIAITGRVVSWLNNAIPNGTRYVVRFTTHPEFIVWEVQDRQEGGNLMPYRAACRRLEFLEHPKGPEQIGYEVPTP